MLEKLIYIKIKTEKTVEDPIDHYNRIIETELKINRFTGKIKEDHSKLNAMVRYVTPSDTQYGNRLIFGESADSNFPMCRCRLNEVDE